MTYTMAHRPPHHHEEYLIRSYVETNPDATILAIISPMLLKNMGSLEHFTQEYGWPGTGDPLAWVLDYAAKRGAVEIAIPQTRAFRHWGEMVDEMRRAQRIA